MTTLLRDIRFALRNLMKRPGFTAIVIVVLGLGSVTQFYQRVPLSQDAGSLKSPRLVQLQNEIRAGKAKAVEAFWQDVVRKETPLVETIPDNNDDVFVTFIWRQQMDTRVIVNTDFAQSVQEMQLIQLPETDVWYKIYCLRNDARFFYQMSVNDPNFPFVGNGPPGTRLNFEQTRFRDSIYRARSLSLQAPFPFLFRD